jgi:oligosaccharide repeat unit polymerase
MFTIAAIVAGNRISKQEAVGFFGNPCSIAFLAAAIIHGFCPALQFYVGEFRYQTDGYTFDSHIISIIASSAALMCIYLGFAFTIRRGDQDIDPNRLIRQQYSSFNFNSNVLLILVIIIPAMIAMFLFSKAVFAAGYENYAADRIGFSYEGVGYYKLVARWLYVGTFVLFAAYCITDPNNTYFRRLLALQVAALVLILFGFNALISSRQAIFILLLGLAAILAGSKTATAGSPLFAHLAYLKISKAAVILVCVVIVGVGAFRHAKHEESSLVSVGYFHKMLNGAFGNHENLLWLNENNYEQFNGQTYVATIVSVVPRKFWPEKPTGGGPALKNLVRPGSYQIGRRGNSSLTTGVLTEAVMNFGWLGVIPISLAFGGLLGLIRKALDSVEDCWGLFIYGYSAVIIGFAGFYGETVGLFTRWIFDVVPILVFQAIYKPPSDP